MNRDQDETANHDQPAGREVLVRLRDFRAGFRRAAGIHSVFRDANLEIRQGDLVCLVGPSGSGKTVLLNLLIQALKPGQGGLKLDGGLEILGQPVQHLDPDSIHRRMGIVFQESALFEDLSVRENVAFGFKGQRLGWKEKAARVTTLLEEVGLPDPPARVHELSGGQKKRVALARTLARNPEFLIYDEPTTGLDPQLCTQIADLIRRTHEGGAGGEGKRTSLVVTHDYQAVLPIADRVLFIDPSKGTIEEVPRGEDPGPRLAAIDKTPRSLEKDPGYGRFLYTLLKLWNTPFTWLSPFEQFVRNPWPSNLRQSLLRMGDVLILPSLYLCAAGAVLGGLATFFALENNPLKGAMDRQALIGLGKVLGAIVVPLMAATLFAARVGAGAAARLGNIRLGRQDDALRMLGTDPGGYLVTPLFWSCVVGLPLVTAPVCAAAFLSSLFCACLTRPVTPFGWASAFFSELTYGDLTFTLIKLAGSGALVAAAAAYLGLKHKAGAEDLGRDVTSTIVSATFLVILWHGAWTFFQYGL